MNGGGETDRSRALRLVPGLFEIAAELDVYASMLARWQSRVNLVGRSTLASVWTRHFADSFQLTGHAGIGATWADLGSGAGFPGLVVALMQAKRNEGEMHLIESDSRKAAFLREVSRETGARAHVWNMRCEAALPRIDPRVIVSRAMAPLPTLIDYALPFVEKGAVGLFMKGRDVDLELTYPSISSRFQLEFSESKIDASSRVVQMRAA